MTPEQEKILKDFNNNAHLLRDFIRSVDWLKRKELSTSTKWVRASVILKKTGWTRAELQTARRNRYINYNEKKQLYDPGSINQDYLAVTKKG